MLLKKLTEAMGPSGFEDEIREVLRHEIQDHADIHYTDVLGSLICEKQTHLSGPRVMLDAHMDEVGLMIVHVEENGLLRFRAIGALDPNVLVSKPVHIGRDRRVGVIGSKPIHLQAVDERRRPLRMNDLYIDIGAMDKQDALKVVGLGDVAVFTTNYSMMGSNCAKGKSFDDRVGCAVLVETLKQSFQLPLYAVFSVQEEIGLRGAQAATYRLRPDIALAIEGTVCFDVPGAPGHGQGTILGAGPALTLQDARTIADKRFMDFMVGVAEKHGIPYQMRRVKGGGNNFGAIHRVGEGVIGAAISVPVRYIHSPAQIVSLEDYENTIRLVTAILRELEQGGFAL